MAWRPLPGSWRKDWRVAVVEEKSEPGGAVKTRELTLPGFRHDVAAMNLSMFAGSPFFQAHKEVLTKHGLAFAPVEDCLRQRVPGRHLSRRQQDVGDDPRAHRGGVDERRAAWQAMLARFGVDAPHIFALLGAAMPSRAAVAAVWKAYASQRRGVVV